MTTLVIGGTGRTGLALAKLLDSAGYPLIITSRSGNAPEPFKAVQFDWFDESTFKNPFKRYNSIDKVYIVGPSILDPLPVVKPFIELALSNGVKRFVLLSASLAPPGGAFAGSVHQYFIDNARDYEYVVLRPCSFMQNFASLYAKAIREENHVFSSAQDGRVAFVHTDDIAQAAFEALTTDKIKRGQLYVVGPQLYSFDEAAKLLSKVLGREITHHRISPEDHINIFTGFGLPRAYVEPLTHAERDYQDGTEEAVFGSSPNEKFVARITLEEYFCDNKSIWM